MLDIAKKHTLGEAESNAYYIETNRNKGKFNKGQNKNKNDSNSRKDNKTMDSSTKECT